MTRRPRPRLTLVLVVVACLVTVGCGRGSGGGGIDPDDLGDLVAARALQARTFRHTSKASGVEVVVEGVVVDDHRYEATVSVDGTKAYQEIVDDDRRYVRVVGIEALFPPSVAAALPELDPAFGPIIAGAWVVDPAGAPPEFEPARPMVPLAPELVLRSVRRLDVLADTVGRGFSRYDRDSVSYLPQHDKFPEHPENGTRFDRVPGAYDPNAAVASLDDIRRYFEYVAVWAEAAGITREERILSLPDPGDSRYGPMYEQLRLAGTDRLRALLDGDDREITETFVVGALPDPPATVATPSDATVADLRAAVEALRRRLGEFGDPTPLYGPV